MDIGGDAVGVYAEAKGEYTRQLCQFLVPALQKFFLDLLDEAKTREPEARKLLLSFQGLLENIAEWNADKVQRETTALGSATQCDYLEELLTAVFIAHTKVLSAIRLTSRQKKLQITIPKLDHFLHRSMTECARILWSNTYLFAPSGTSIERQKNMRQIESHINDGVHQAIRGMLPVKSILKEYLKDEPGDDEEDEKEEKEEKAEKEKEPEPEKEEDAAPEAPVTPEVPAAPEAAVAPEAPAAPDAPAVPLDISGGTPVLETTAPDLSGLSITVASAAPAATPAPEPQTIVVDTAPQVQFTGLDSVFDQDNPEDSTFKPMNEEGEGDEDVIEDLKILDEPPEAMDDFEDLDKPAEETLAMDFEEL